MLNRALQVVPIKHTPYKRVYKVDDVDFYRMTINKKINGTRTNGKDYDIKMTMVMKETTKTVAIAAR